MRAPYINTEAYIELSGLTLGAKARVWLSNTGDYARNGLVEIILIGLGFVSGVLVTRWLGPAGRGQLTAAVMWPTTAGTVISLGLQHAFAYAVGVGWATPQRLQTMALTLTGLVGLPTMLVFWYLCPWIFHTQFGDQIWIPRVFALFIPLSLYSGLLLPIYQGAGDFTRWNVARLFRSGAWTAGVVLLGSIAVLTVTKLLLVQLVILFVLGGFLFSQLSRIKMRADVKENAPLDRILKYGLAVYVSGLAYTVNQQLDQLLLSLWVVPSDLGQYAAAATLSSVLLIVPAMVGPIVFSKVARATADYHGQRQHIRMAIVFVLALLLPLGLIMMALARWLTQLLYGPEYLLAGAILRILAPAAIFLGAGIALSDVLRGAGKPMWATYGALTGALITVIGLALALPKFGVWGAAWVSLSAYAAMMIVQVMLLGFWLRNHSTPAQDSSSVVLTA